MRARLVQLSGHGRFWWQTNDGKSGALAPLAPCDDNGHLRNELVLMVVLGFAQSYAHVMKDGRILRYNEVIGRRSDLVEVK